MLSPQLLRILTHVLAARSAEAMAVSPAATTSVRLYPTYCTPPPSTMSPRASDSVGINQDRGRLPDDEVGEADARGF